MRRMWKAGVFLAAAVALYQVSAGASGSSIPAPSAGAGPSAPMMTPEEMARGAYNSGIDHKDKGLKLEQKAAAEQAKDQEKDSREGEGRIRRGRSRTSRRPPTWRRASTRRTTAWASPTGRPATMPRRWRCTTRRSRSRQAFPDAVEYRGEAYLGVNRVDDAKQAYLELFASDRKQADILMKAMTDWVAKRRVDAAGADPASVSALESWIKERSALAGQTASMALAAQHDTWR